MREVIICEGRKYRITEETYVCDILRCGCVGGGNYTDQDREEKILCIFGYKAAVDVVKLQRTRILTLEKSEIFQRKISARD